MPRLKPRPRDNELLRGKRLLALQRAEEACRYLCGLGAKEVYVFGSLPSGDFKQHSDIDLAVSGLPREHFYKVESKIEEILGGMHFDLVYMETAPTYLTERIREMGTRYACDIS